MSKQPKRNDPPKWPLRLFSRLLNPDFMEELEGDLEERYQDNLEVHGSEKSNWLYFFDVIKLLHPVLLKKIKSVDPTIHTGLLVNHIRFTLRLFARNKYYTSLNLIGLVLGITSGLIGILFLQNQLTYDQHHERHADIYRVTNRIQMTGFDANQAMTAQELAPLVADNLPELETYVRFVPFDEEQQTVTIIREAENGNKVQFFEERLWRADSNVFSMFTHEFIHGNPSTSLVGPGKLVLTASMAEKYFGQNSPIGQTLKVKSIKEETFRVSGVIEDLPENTHFKYDFLVSGIPDRPWIPYAGFGHTIWNPSAYTYLIFKEGYDPTQFAERFAPIFDQHYTATAEELGGIYTPTLEPLTDVHFNSATLDDQPQGDLTFVYVFGGVVALVILMVCINYINLSTAKSLTRTREMGVRKVLGTTRGGLFYAVMMETVLLIFIALYISILLTYLILQSTTFTDIIGTSLRFDLVENPILISSITGLIAFITLLSGIYPGIYIPSFSTAEALKGNTRGQGSDSLFRKGLIIVQFSISIVVIICTLLMGRQLTFMQEKELGFDQDNLLLMKIPDNISREMLQASVSEFAALPSVTTATYATSFPGDSADPRTIFSIEQEGQFVQREIRQNFVGEDYLKTMDLSLLEGRDFFPGSEEDEMSAFIINESVVEKMGWKDSPIGKSIERWDGKKLGQVVGLVNDYNYASLRQGIAPQFIRLFRVPDEDESAGYYHLKLGSDDLPEALFEIEQQWNLLFADEIFDFQFLDQQVQRQYEADQRQNQLFTILSTISIIIALLGLTGLVLYSATQRTKEIGIRKVLGSSIIGILALLSKEYIILVMVACGIAIPIAASFIQEWLDNFAYQTTIHWWYYALPSLAIVIVILIIVSSQSMKAAMTNPVDSLRID